ncbi:MAG TPA: recombinase family protein [Candidatus Dormibacteraeota bacterium]|nr:recombinase family protein [Candidatus Dormibacteraeota bacterium]
MERIHQLHRKPRGRERLSYGAIAATLNAERLPTRTGVPWRAGTVRRILRCEAVSL